MLSALTAAPILIVMRKIKRAVARWITVHTGWARHSPDDWTSRSLCAALPIDQSDPMFFGVETRESPAQLIAAANKARTICTRCPVAARCLTEALTNDERYGVWGTTSGRQREKLRTRIAAGATIEQVVREVLPDAAA